MTVRFVRSSGTVCLPAYLLKTVSRTQELINANIQEIRLLLLLFFFTTTRISFVTNPWLRNIFNPELRTKTSASRLLCLPGTELFQPWRTETFPDAACYPEIMRNCIVSLHTFCGHHPSMHFPCHTCPMSEFTLIRTWSNIPDSGRQQKIP